MYNHTSSFETPEDGLLRMRETQSAELHTLELHRHDPGRPVLKMEWKS